MLLGVCVIPANVKTVESANQAKQDKQSDVYRKSENGVGVVKGKYDKTKAWRVYLTKSETTAYELAHGFGLAMNIKEADVSAVKCGRVDGGDGLVLVPPLYRGQGYYYAAKEHKATHNGGIVVVIC